MRTDLHNHLLTYLPDEHATPDAIAALGAAADTWHLITDGTPEDGLYPTRVRIDYGTEGAYAIRLHDDGSGERLVSVSDEAGVVFNGDAIASWGCDAQHIATNGTRTVLLSDGKSA